MFLISTPHKTKTSTVRLAVTTNTKEKNLQQMCCLDLRVVPIGPIVTRKRSYSIPNIGNMMGCDHPSCVAFGPLAGELYHLNIFQQRPSAILNFKNFNISSRDYHCCPNLLLYTKFHQNWFTRSASRRPYLLNVQCAVARQRPLPCHGNRIIMANMSG